jgi:hypothetical protein
MTDTAAGGRLRTKARTSSVSRRAAPANPLLWSVEDLLRWVITVGLGGIVVAVAWYVAAGEATFSQQVGPIDAALAGLVLTGLGNVTWLLHGRRALGERRRLLLPDVAAAATTRVAVTARRVAGDPSPTGTVEEVFLAGEGMERYHRPDCAMAAGRTGWSTATRHNHEAAGRRPCGVCRP